MKKAMILAAIFAACFFNSCDSSSSYEQSNATEAQANPEDAQIAAIKQKLAEKQQNGEITDEQAAALLLLILAAIANESGNANEASNFSPEYGNSGYSEDEVMDMVIDHSINPVGTIDYNY
ncbi:hypothetical protein [Haliscomenobacter sp.]|jgi:hypothetical protein|uniref:hypothetical protein n=1 Tax=Haliscomenobacter sp. TaxID=2717303 RepID=UPI003364FE6A